MIADWKRFGMHLPVGIVAPLFLLVQDGWVLSAVWMYGFLRYEETQGGEPFKDIQGAIGGLCMGTVILWAITTF